MDVLPEEEKRLASRFSSSGDAVLKVRAISSDRGLDIEEGKWLDLLNCSKGQPTLGGGAILDECRGSKWRYPNPVLSGQPLQEST